METCSFFERVRKAGVPLCPGHLLISFFTTKSHTFCPVFHCADWTATTMYLLALSSQLPSCKLCTEDGNPAWAVERKLSFVCD